MHLRKRILRFFKLLNRSIQDLSDHGASKEPKMHSFRFKKPILYFLLKNPAPLANSPSYAWGQNGGFTLKTHQMFSVQTTPERNLTTQQYPVSLDLWLREIRAGKSNYFRNVIVSEEFRFKTFFVHTSMKIQRFQIPSVWRAFLKISLRLTCEKAPGEDGKKNRRAQNWRIRKEKWFGRDNSYES